MHRRLQFDMRENPASDRRHGSRPAVGSTANGSYREHENLMSRERERCTTRLPGIHLGKYWRFREQEIHEWIETQRGASHAA